MPSVRALAQQLTVSVITTRRAYEELEREGLIRTRPGMGSYVAEAQSEGFSAARLAHVRALFAAALAEAVRMGLHREQIEMIMQDLLSENSERQETEGGRENDDNR